MHKRQAPRKLSFSYDQPWYRSCHHSRFSQARPRSKLLNEASTDGPAEERGRFLAELGEHYYAAYVGLVGLRDIMALCYRLTNGMTTGTKDS